MTNGPLPDQLESEARTRHYVDGMLITARRGIDWPAGTTVTDDSINEKVVLSGLGGSGFSLIDSATILVSTAAVSFVDIPGSYRHLFMEWSATSAGLSANVCVQFNGDTSTNYDYTVGVNDGGDESQSTEYNPSLTALMIGSAASSGGSEVGIGTVEIPNYTVGDDSAFYRNVMARSTRSGILSLSIGGQWLNLDESITDIDVIAVAADSGSWDVGVPTTFEIGTRFALYGVA